MSEFPLERENIREKPSDLRLEIYDRLRKDGIKLDIVLFFMYGRLEEGVVDESELPIDREKVGTTPLGIRFIRQKLESNLRENPDNQIEQEILSQIPKNGAISTEAFIRLVLDYPSLLKVITDPECRNSYTRARFQDKKVFNTTDLSSYINTKYSNGRGMLLEDSSGKSGTFLMLRSESGPILIDPLEYIKKDIPHRPKIEKLQYSVQGEQV